MFLVMDHSHLDRRAENVELAYARRNVGTSGMHVLLHKLICCLNVGMLVAVCKPCIREWVCLRYQDKLYQNDQI